MLEDPLRNSPTKKSSGEKEPEEPRDPLIETCENFYSKIEVPNFKVYASSPGTPLGFSGELQMKLNPREVKERNGNSLREIVIEDLRIVLTPEEASKYLPSPTNEPWLLIYANASLIVPMDKEGPIGQRTVPGFSTLTPEKGGIAITNHSEIPPLDNDTICEILNQAAERL